MTAALVGYDFGKPASSLRCYLEPVFGEPPYHRTCVQTPEHSGLLRQSEPSNVGHYATTVDDSQLRHIDHGWSSSVHGVHGSTTDGVIAVRDSSRGALTDQSTFYVELSRTRDLAAVLNDNAEQLVKVPMDDTGERQTVIEAVDAPVGLDPEEIVRLPADKIVGEQPVHQLLRRGQ